MEMKRIVMLQLYYSSDLQGELCVFNLCVCVCVFATVTRFRACATPHTLVS